MSILHPSTFDYLQPTDKQKAAMARLRAAAKAYSDVLEAELPSGADKTYVLRAHRSNAMWVNVAVTRQPDGAPRTDDDADAVQQQSAAPGRAAPTGLPPVIG